MKIALTDAYEALPASGATGLPPAPFKTQLLKWVGNKQRFAHEIVSFLPQDYGTYFEPFLGAGGVMATLRPHRALGSDSFAPLVEIWQALIETPETLVSWYGDRHAAFQDGDRTEVYEAIKARYNAAPNGADFLFLCRACYGGVVRFRRKDSYMSTPCGSHPLIGPEKFAARVGVWRDRMAGARFACLDYRQAMAQARAGDVIYCDPPYAHSQTILYGAQAFRLEELFATIAACKARGVRVAMSIDGTKKSGDVYCDIEIPSGLFERETLVNTGQSMLKRFQMGGQRMETEAVRDRLLLTY
ncbi:MAG: DNA methyltransferase [Alphaproteobacteria bacterium MedPE-SWcel]|nr:MAG: DNA methyltransferase [Alphaproteobacteria bacterium MedPE-SWcel]